MPTARYGGSQAHAVLAGVTYETSEWRAEVTSETAVGRAGGDTWTHRTRTFKDWNASFTAFSPIGSVPNPFALVGTSCAFAGHIVTGGTGYFVATGNVKKAGTAVQVEDHWEFDVELECVDGSSSGGPTITTGSP